MRVCWVIGGIGHGGVITVCKAAAEAVARLTEHQVTLVGVHSCVEDFVPPEGVRFHVLNLPERPDSACNGFHTWLTQNRQDVLFMNDASQLEPYWPYVPEDVALIPVLHDDWRRWRAAIIEHHRHLDAVVVVARFLEDILRREMPQFAGILRTIHNGCNFPPLRQTCCSSTHLNLLFVGSMDVLKKGVLDVPKILQRVPHLWSFSRLTVVGGEHPWLRRALRTIGYENVAWLGHLPHRECLEVMGRCDVLLVPSRCEAFGMVAVEAMAMGCVPIAYDIQTGLREIIEDKKSGFLVPLGDYEAYASKLVLLHSDRGLLQGMKSAAFNRARSYFSAERMGRDYADVIRDVLRSRQVARPQRLHFSAFRLLPPSRTVYHKVFSESARCFLRDLAGCSPRVAYLIGQWKQRGLL